MPFCTACGKQNPDDARFCAQCGTKLLVGEDTGSSPVESTATITFGVPDQRESSDRQLSPVDAAAVDALPEGHALLVVQRGPSAGSRFLLDTDVVGAGRHPDSEIFLDDVTVSRRHAEFRRTGAGYTRQRRRQPQRHLRQPRPHRLRRAQRRRRGPDRQVPPGVLLLPPEQLIRECPDALGIESRRPLQHRAGPRPAARRLPRGDDPQDPLPRGPGPGQARAHRGRLPQVLRRRRRAPALHPADAARPLPPAQGDRRPPRRHRPGPRAAGHRVRRADRAQGGAELRRPAQPGVVPPHQRPAALAPRAAQGRRHLRGAARPARAVRPGERAHRARATSTATPSSSRRPPASSPTSASSRATCAPSRPPPTARSAWSSRSSPPWPAVATRPPGGAPRTPRPRSRRCPCACTPPW